MIIILLIILVLILVNGFFAASEMALVSITPSDLHRIKSEGHKNALILEKVTKDSTRYLSTIQVVITFAGFLSSAFAGNSLSGDFITLLGKINIVVPENIAVIFITIVLSFFTLVFGELVPKRIALAKSEGFALVAAPIVYVSMIMFKPFVSLLTLSTRGVLKLIGIKPQNDQDAISENDIKEMIVYGHIKGLYQTEEKNMMQRIFQFDDLTADMVMTPKIDVIGLNIDQVSNQLLQSIIKSHYSRIPVFKGSKDHILGVILIKDVLIELENNDLKDINLKSLIRKPIIIQKNTKLNILLKKMRETSQHLVFVFDENDTLEGIVTLEDIVEEIIGNIYDEHDYYEEAQKDIFTYIIDGEMTTQEFEDTLGITLDKLLYKNISEFVLHGFKDYPKKGDSLELFFGEFVVLEVTDTEIIQLKLKLKE